MGEDFSIYFCTSLLCLKSLRTVCVTIVPITQQLEKYRLRLLLSDLSHYCCFRETLLMPSQIVDKIYLCRYAYCVSVSVGDVLQCEQKARNREDPQSWKTIGLTLGHVPHTIIISFGIFCVFAIICEICEIYLTKVCMHTVLYVLLNTLHLAHISVTYTQ